MESTPLVATNRKSPSIVPIDHLLRGRIPRRAPKDKKFILRRDRRSEAQGASRIVRQSALLPTAEIPRKRPTPKLCDIGNIIRPTDENELSSNCSTGCSDRGS